MFRMILAPSQEYSPAGIDPVSNHIINSVDAFGNIVARGVLSGGALTDSAIAQFDRYAATGNLSGYYVYLASFGSGYGRIGVDYYDGLFDPKTFVSNKFTEIMSGGAFQVGNDLYQKIAVDLMRKHLEYLMADGFIPTTQEIFAIHREVFLADGLGAGSWIGDTLMAPFVQWGLGQEPSNYIPASRFGAGQNVFQQFGPHCFPSGTPIQLASGQIADIDALRLGDEIAAFSGAQYGGRGGLASKPITRLFHNITDTWVTLSNGLTVTPGHHFLDSFGNFRTIADILETDGQVVLEDGSVTKVTGEYIHYSEQTADLYEQAEGYVSATVGNLALAPVYENISEVRILQ